MSDQDLEPLLATFDRHAQGGNFGTLPAIEKDEFRAIRLVVDSVARGAVGLGLGQLTSDFYTSVLSPSGRIPNHFWSCVYPSQVVHKSYALQIAVLLSTAGVELCCCLGAGNTEVKSAEARVDMNESLKTVKLRLCNLPEQVRIQLRSDLTGELFLRKKWRLTPNQRDYTEINDWLSYAADENSSGASISRYFERGKLPTSDQLELLFRSAIRQFSPLFDAVYSDLPPDAAPRPVAPDIKRVGRGRRVWVIAAGRKGEWWDDWQASRIATIGWDKLGDLRDYSTKKAMLAKLEDGQPAGVRPKSIAFACWQFSHEMRPGDLVVVKSGKRMILGAGEVDSDYRFDSMRPNQLHTRGVHWFKSDPTILPAGMKSFALKTLTNVSGKSDLVAFLINYADQSTIGVAQPVSAVTQPYTVDDAMRDLFMPRSQFDSILDRLRRKKNLILQGSPGVGKTFVAKRVAYALLGETDVARVETVQFHQSYAYEDFVQGWRPNGDGGFELRNGLFHAVCAAAAADPDRPHVLVIAEINRGNVSRIFGELLMLIEADYRGKEHSIPLMYAGGRGDRFYVPANLYLIGLMNTADRSLAMVDYALRRRFAFATVEPGFATDGFGEHLTAAGADDALRAKVRDRLTKLNVDIEADKELGPGFRVGHSYFCPPTGGATEAWYRDVVESEVAPLLREYWFDKREKAETQVATMLA